jgi:hypothetical protein
VELQGVVLAIFSRFVAVLSSKMAATTDTSPFFYLAAQNSDKTAENGQYNSLELHNSFYTAPSAAKITANTVVGKNAKLLYDSSSNGWPTPDGSNIFNLHSCSPSNKNTPSVTLAPPFAGCTTSWLPFVHVPLGSGGTKRTAAATQSAAQLSH